MAQVTAPIVLVFGDDPRLGRLVKLALEQDHFQVRAAATADELR